ncbi:nonribosomal peptide synthetase ftmA [Aspergillus udagawae]|uniref:Nonribosomal peptide synthase n=1 Tax=Aspergillus udagawae TaxID=91492 RepID=A0A8E0QYG9_9EURO|nr:nonribosomal peptide synthase [Aspergillus udagawae]GIC93737.1 nonribosomal peptide synthase [Aspergillus udagawae]
MDPASGSQPQSQRHRPAAGAFTIKLPPRIIGSLTSESSPASASSDSTPVFTPFSAQSPAALTPSTPSDSGSGELFFRETKADGGLPDDFDSKVPKSWDTCVHDVITQKCQQAPEAPAIAAWDGSFTYGELDTLSTRLASILVLLGVKPETFVPICMDKSRWTTVAILGVMKAGGAFALLDPSHPVSRLHTLCEDLGAGMVLTCTAQRERCMAIANAIVVDRLCEAWFPSTTRSTTTTTTATTTTTPEMNSPQTTKPVSPTNALYVAFTSGSTGKPKGVVIEHRAYASGAREHLPVFEIDHTSRVLQFSSYAFDVSIMETLSTLMAGGCLCVPDETARTDPGLFVDALNHFQVTHAMLTPSFARTMPWHEVKYIRTLILGGEAMQPAEAAVYAERGIWLVNAYGTAECSVNATTGPGIKPGSDPNRVSRPTGTVIWLIDPDDPEKEPVGPGVEGEVLLEGPIVGREYLNNRTATAKAFIDPPGWLKRRRAGQYQHRLYRTGDLAVRDGSTGALTLLGRREGQVKIRGQRVELAEIEQHLQETFPRATEVVVEKVTTECDKRDSLVAFIQLDKQKTMSSNPSLLSPVDADSGSLLFLPADSASITQFAAVQTQLQDRLPKHMIPSLFIRVVSLPRTSSGKVNRSILRATAARLSRADLQAFASARTQSRAPATAMEFALQQVYADVLGLPLTKIGMDDSFVQLGGDSILAVRLVGAARKAGLALGIRDVLGPTRLEAQAQAATVAAAATVPDMSTSPPEYVCFAALGTRCRVEVLRIAEEQCGVPRAGIEDVYPCTPLQEGMFAMSMSQPGMYSDRIVFEVPQSVCKSRFRAAWEETVRATPILRTRIIQTPEGLLQVVIREAGDMLWDYEREEYNSLPIRPGGPLMRCSLVGGKLILTIHHAVWDAWTMQLVHERLQRAFKGELRPEPSSRPFHPFIQYLQGIDNDALDAFWREQLAGHESAIFPSLPSAQYRPSPTAVLQYTVQNIHMAARSHTLATYIHLAWALVVAEYTDSAEVMYGLTVSGRSAPLANIAGIAGPTIATVPMRVSVGSKDTVPAVLQQIHSRTIGMIPHEQAGLQRIAKASPDAARACRFQSHLNIQVAPAAAEQAERLFPLIHGTPGRGMDLTRFSNYALNLLLQLSGDGSTVTVHVAYDPQILSGGEVTRILQQWEHVLHQVSRQPTVKLNEIDLLSTRDWDDLKRWNAIIPTADRRCLQELVLAQEALKPQRLAVSAWDGDFTYKQLVALSASLARRLKPLAVGRGSFVPICMEKSRWTIVAILGVLRAGGTCVLLDPKHPRQRLQEIIRSVSARLLIHDASTAPLTKDLTPSALCVSAELTKRLKRNSHKMHRSPPSNLHSNPDDLAFVIFTSGSTGRPKGIAMPHYALSTSIRDHSAGMKVDAATRALHLSSYAFDVSIYEIFTTLAVGGCICVPSEFERMNQLAESIEKYGTNWSFMTPSVAQTLNPAEVPSLTTLVLGGEAVTQEHVDGWAFSLSSSSSSFSPSRSLINGYGPAEATICAVGPIQPRHWRPGTIGRVVGGVGWVTKPSDPSQLVGIGAIGELLLEGPFLAHGYLNQPDVTAASFIDPPPWRLRLPFACDAGEGNTKTRLYRTGDLVQYLEDGSIRYLGRRDTQVKIRGQRVDLGEVEAQVRRGFPGASGAQGGGLDVEQAQVVAETVSLPMAKGAASTLLVAFIERPQVTKDPLLLPPTDAEFQHAIPRVQAHLKSTLPPYMVPSLYIPVCRVPMTVTGKIDRRLLRDALRALAPHNLQLYRVTDQRRSITTTVSSAAAHRLRAIWAELLGVPCEAIGAEDTFISHGGDSVTAMRMLAIARRQGFRFTVADVLNNWTLARLALQQASPSQDTPPSSAPAKGVMAVQRGTGTGHHPSTTDTQAFLIQRYPWMHWRFSIEGDVNTERLRTACTRLIAAHSILRTRFERDPSGGAKPAQIVMQGLDNPFHTVTTADDDDLERYTQSLSEAEQTMDVLSASTQQPPTRFTLVSNSLRTAHILVARLSHAQYDGICVPKIFADLEALYNRPDARIAPTDFERYLNERTAYGAQNKRSLDFWREYLVNCPPPAILPAHSLSPSPSTPSSTTSPQPSLSTASASHTLQYSTLPAGATLAMVIKAAACLAIARRTGQEDILVGQIVNGRSLPVPQIDEVVGPCVNCIPFRAVIAPTMRAREYLWHIRSQHNSSIEHEGVDFSTIIERCATHLDQPTSKTTTSSTITTIRTPQTTRLALETLNIILQHQNIDMDLHMNLAGATYKSFTSSGSLRPASEVWICSTPRRSPSGPAVEVQVVASSAVLSKEMADCLACDVVDVTRVLVDDSMQDRELRTLGVGLS